MNPITPFNMRSLMIVLACGIPPASMAFDSGSTDTDGTLSPIVDTIVQLPDSGILNYSSITIPIGVTVGFSKNTTNTPVTLLVSGDVSILGTLDISGGNSTDVGAAGDGNVGDDGLAGLGGSGGFNGGNGGDIDSIGGAGLGPGGGEPGAGLCTRASSVFRSGGAGGGYATLGKTTSIHCSPIPQAGNNYGNVNLLPIIGGSGGGGAYGGLAFKGSGGGGGGGGILLAASGTVDISGNLIADGGKSGSSTGTSSNSGGTGGGGSGGAIRILATNITGNGVISALGGNAGTGLGSQSITSKGGNGSVGRIRLEADTILRTVATTPGYSFSAPQPIFLASLPSLRILSVAGANAPASPTGSADIILAATTPNPVNVIFETSNIPLGNTITLTVIPTIGNRSSIISSAINGNLALGTASASIDLPLGPSVLTGQVSYTVSASLGNALSRFAKGEQVERIRVVAALQGESKTTLITVAGNEYTLPSKAVRFN